jgi:hypothetical protein
MERYMAAKNIQTTLLQNIIFYEYNIENVQKQEVTELKSPQISTNFY